jgi:hypothetical protein
MKCTHCGAENPDYAFFCGRCSADLKQDLVSGSAGPSTEKPAISIESLLSPKLLRIEDNIRSGRERFLGRLRFPSRQFAITFRSELETITLVVEKDGHASTVKEYPQEKVLMLEGAHEDFVRMLNAQEGFGMIPDSIRVTLAGKAMPDATSERAVREGVEKTLARLMKR